MDGRILYQVKERKWVRCVCVCVSTFTVSLLHAGPCPMHQLYSKESDKDPALMKFTCPYGRVAISKHNSG